MTSPSIHILGLGNLGKLFAHALRRNHPEIPITLLFHRPSLVDDWNNAGRGIEIVRNNVSDNQHGFNYQIVKDDEGDDIENLLVATKTHATVEAIQPLRNRLRPTSTMLFLQNGIGSVDEVDTPFSHNHQLRPTYLSGIVNHGVYATSTFSSVHAGLADVFIGPVVSDKHAKSSTESSAPPFLVQKILECPELSASWVTAQELLFIQLQKLAVNAVFNPLTSIFDCRNGELFASSAISDLIYRLIAETAYIIRAHIGSLGHAVTPSIQARFSPESLRKLVNDIGVKTAKNISSMRQDVLAGRKTEIGHINGYLVTRAGSLGVPCPINTTLVSLINEKRKLSEKDIDNVFGASQIASGD
ncbi:2-dehydropantoate 2-reductase [Lophiostoma macrostomum CBS 122681]|uniref:2-dehydropantoate 2-reductase n=1 Tax=Lophiostoma macrostomum CBS 122681 TaxID=1314788 RepID=A0A6A6T4L1_9PLEO|nr:2-dehydropantoate 2-reductase [Lophiostoma macrostomum CBS 122681]